MSAATRIDSIQYLRGIAALAVALSHIASMQRSLAPDVALVIPEFAGFWGVDIFFVISGFIIVHITRDVAPGFSQASVFMLKRIVRIVPCYWFFTILMYFADTQHWFSDQKTLTNIPMLLKSLFFVKPGFPLLFVGWTLTLEMFFYLVFAAGLSVFGSSQRFLLVTGTFVFLTGLRLFVDTDQRYFVFYTQPILLEFVAGMMLAQLYDRMRVVLADVHGWLFLLSGVMLLSFVTLLVQEAGLIAQRALWWGVPAVLIVTGALHIPVRSHNRLLYGLGTVSYSLYVCHIPCAYAGFRIASIFFAGQPEILWVYCGLAIIFTAVVTLASWWLFERVPQTALGRVLAA